MKKLLGCIFILIPAIFAWYLDKDLSSKVHIPIIGITAVCVALCDALFGQIVASTRWIPFSACYKPADAQELAKRFRSYHKSLFFSWMTAKICSSIAITISAVMMLKNPPPMLVTYQMWMFLCGYIVLGIALVMAIGFVFTYLQAAEESDNAKLREMNYTYEKEHPELYHYDPEVIAQQLNELPKGYNSKPSIAKTVS